MSLRGRPSAIQRRVALLLLVGSFIVLGVMGVFAFELADTQAKSKSDVVARVHERAMLAAALIDHLFQTVQQEIPLYRQRFGARTVSTRSMNRYRQDSVYAVLLDSAGHVIASSRGFTSQARSDLSHSAALALVGSGHPYGLGNLLPYGSTGVVNFAVRFPTRYGTRILLSGISPRVLGPFLGGDLRQIPGVRGEHNYVIDGLDTVLGSNYDARPPGYRFTQPAQVEALRHSPGERRGNYYLQEGLSNSTWRVVLAAPAGTLFASVSGLRKWVPWIIFAAFTVVAAGALALGRRVLRSSEEIRVVNAQLEAVNRDLAATNGSLEDRAIELARSNADLEQFASIASHDLQEPLRKIRTFTEQLTLIEADRLSVKGRDYLQRTNRAATRMQGLIQDLLSFSRVTTHGRAFASIDLGLLTHEVLEDLSSEVEEARALVHVGHLPLIRADAVQMRQLIQNLISNALKFRRDGVPPEIWIEARGADEKVRLIVRDNGIGFEPRYAERIFRVFERLNGRSAYPGTGIGLALCRKIVECHGGSIVAEGKLGAGAIFTVMLPAHGVETIVVARPETADVPAVEREEMYVPA